MPYFYYYDPMLWAVLALALVGLIASARVQSTFRKYSQMPAQRRMRAGRCGHATLRSACSLTVEATRS